MTARKKGKSARAAGLSEYRKKRDFQRTSEPRGGDLAASDSGRTFVVQKHAARNLHYDFRLEMNGVLKSWAVPKGPSLDPKQKPLAVHVEDHPIEYAFFEGVIPKDEYGGGTVMLWDCGEWEPIGDAAEGYEGGDLKFRLHGEKLKGAWVLARMGGDAGDDGRNWLLIKKRDAEARPVTSFNVLAELPFSVASGRTMEEITAAPDAVWTDGRARPVADGRTGADAVAAGEHGVPDPSGLPGAVASPTLAKVRPQLAASTARPPEGERWLHEVKLDGYRLMCRIDAGAVRLLTRNGHDWTERFPAVARAAGRLPVDSIVLDGEVVVLDAEGMPDFAALQNAFQGGVRRAFTYFVFDVPYARGYDLTRVPLLDRKAYLAEVVQAAPMIAPTIQFCSHFVGDGATVFAHAAQLGLEGIISKRVDAPYVQKRSDTWMKVKNTLRQELVVGGFTDPGGGGRTGLGALLVGYHDERGRLVYCGRVGSGFSEATLEMLDAQLRRRARKTSPFSNPEADPDAASVHWVRPELVAEVRFTSWTSDDLLRHPVFLGLRSDVDPGDVVLERTRVVASPRAEEPAAAPPDVVEAPPAPGDARVAGVRITNPDRTVYPEDRVTKRDVAAYYEAVAEWILPYVVRRPLSLVRCPLGLAGESFYQRRVGDGFPGSIRGVAIDEAVDGEPFLLIDDLEGLVSLAQMGVLEIHTWGCREDDLERPDHLVFDLDPGPGLVWEHVVASAEFVRVYLDDLGLTSFVKTSGGSGIHVVVPITRRTPWPEVRAFAHAVARDIIRLAPQNFVATMSKVFRKQRVFVDYLRNQRGATAIAPYSTRARPGACVATPLGWDELAAEQPPTAFTVRTVPPRLAGLAGDPWCGYRRTRQSITTRMRRQVGAAG